MEKEMKNIVWWVMGAILLILGIIGLMLPVIPQVPFLLASLLCFGNASKRFQRFLKNNKYYQYATDKLRGTKLYALFEDKREIHQKKKANRKEQRNQKNQHSC